MIRAVMTMLLVVLALQIAGCGKRARYLDPPDPDAAGDYPKHYPPPDAPGTHL
jgi:hypothetical protein